MKNFKNFAQAENALNELQCSKCKYDLSHYPDYFKSSRKDTDSKFRNYNNKYRHKLYLQPENLFFGVFNRMHISGRVFNFSIISESTINDTLAPIFSEIEKLRDPGIKILVNEDVLPEILSKRDLKIERIWELIQQIFSEEFISTNNITNDYLAKNTEALKNKSIDKSSQYSQFHNFRLEEMRDDLRIVFMINPKTLEVKLCYSPRLAMESAISEFFYNFFNASGFWRFVSRNLVKLGMKRDYDWKYNDCNVSSFSITHHTYGMRMDSPFGVAISSGKAQMKFVDELLIFMTLNYGEDDFLYTEIKRETEFYCENVTDIEDKLKKLKYYDGLRIYSSPFFDIYIRFAPRTLGDQLYFNTSVHVFPFCNLTESHKINKGWEEHPMVEFWEIK